MAKQKLAHLLHTLTTPARWIWQQILALAARLAPRSISVGDFSLAVEAASQHRIRAVGVKSPISCSCRAMFPCTPQGRDDAHAHVAAKILQAAGVGVERG